jgi:hypothetical protein
MPSALAPAQDNRRRYQSHPPRTGYGEHIDQPEAGGTVARERHHIPEKIDPSGFDYAAEERQQWRTK